MKNKFTKADLKDGMVVEYRDGRRRLVINGCLIGERDYMNFERFDENLKEENSSELDIVKVFKVKKEMPLEYIFDNSGLELIWERIETKCMTTEEMRQKLEELTGEKIEVEPSREEMIGKIKLYCVKKSICAECVLLKMCNRCNYWKFDDYKLKKCYEKVMKDG